MPRALSRSHLLVLFCLGVLCVSSASILVVQYIGSRPQVSTDTVHTGVVVNAVTNSGSVNAAPATQVPVFTTTEFAVVSNDMVDGEALAQQFTCDGAGAFPDVQVLNVPKKAVSLAIVIHDPDIATAIRADHTWYHFGAWNLPTTTTRVTTQLPEPVRYATTTSRTTTFVPPCPPDNTHRYVFTVYALDTVLDLPAGATVPEVLTALDGHEIKKASLTVTYNRHAQDSSVD